MFHHLPPPPTNGFVPYPPLFPPGFHPQFSPPFFPQGRWMFHPHGTSDQDFDAVDGCANTIGAATPDRS
jgi:hypothetical protein